MLKGRMECPKCKFKFKDPSKVLGGQNSKRQITDEQQAKMQEGKRVKSLSKRK